MSQPNISRRLLNALLPDGPPWYPKKNEDFDKFLNGLSLNIENLLLYLEQLSNVRNPYNIPIELLPDLEKEYGIITKNNISIETRRMQLAVKIYTNGGTGSPDDLQNALRGAGFDVYVHPNDPAIDPAILLDQNFQVTIGDPVSAYIGDPNAYFGKFGGYLLVNGSIFTRRPKYLGIGDPVFAYIGDPNAQIGYFLGLEINEKTYNIPTDSDTWPFIFFVGGQAARGGSGELISIENAEIPAERQSEFENIILRIKPVFTWAGIIVTYV